MTDRFFARLRRVAVVPAVLAGLCFTALPATASADDGDVNFDPPARLVLGLGQFNFMNTGGDPIPDNNHTSVLGRAEYRSNYWLYSDSSEKWKWGLAPQLGALINSDGGMMGYAGLYADFMHECGFFFSPALNVGVYTRGDGRDLGGPLQFEEEITFGYEMDSRSRLGVTFSHISNADLYDSNPGVETVMLSYSLPLGGGTAKPAPKPAAPAIMDLDAEDPAQENKTEAGPDDSAARARADEDGAAFARLAVTAKPAYNGGAGWIKMAAADTARARTHLMSSGPSAAAPDTGAESPGNP